MPVRYNGVCEHCHNSYERGSSPRYCSRECYVNSRWTSRVCLSCSKTFRTRKIYVNRGQMSYCSPQCGHNASRKTADVEFGGIRFALDLNGYYVETAKSQRKLHRYIWEKHNGHIPDGHVVHHLNEVKTDNRIENLALMKWADHTAEHSRRRWASGKLIGKPSKACGADGCDRKSKAKGLCTMHYQRMKAKERGRWL